MLFKLKLEAASLNAGTNVRSKRCLPALRLHSDASKRSAGISFFKAALLSLAAIRREGVPKILTTGSSTEPKRIRPAYAPVETRRQAIKLFKAGLGYKSVSTILNLSQNTVRDWKRAFVKGKFSAELSGNQFRYDESIKETVLSLRAEGLSWKAISDATGVTKSTCRTWVNAAAEKRQLPEDLPEDEASLVKTA